MNYELQNGFSRNYQKSNVPVAYYLQVSFVFIYLSSVNFD